MNFEIEIIGYNGSTDETDDLILWIEAGSEDAVLDVIKPVRAMVSKIRKLASEIVSADAILPHDDVLLCELITQRFSTVNRDLQIEALTSALAGLMPLREQESAVYKYEAEFEAAEKALQLGKSPAPLKSYAIPHTIIAENGSITDRLVMDFQAEDQGHAIEQLIDCYRMVGQKLIKVKDDGDETDTVLHQIGEKDFVMSPLLNENGCRSVWIEVGNIAVQLTRTLDNVEVHLFSAVNDDDVEMDSVAYSFSKAVSFIHALKQV